MKGRLLTDTSSIAAPSNDIDLSVRKLGGVLNERLEIVLNITKS
jgi:hypothetical protein